MADLRATIQAAEERAQGVVLARSAHENAVGLHHAESVREAQRAAAVAAAQEYEIGHSYNRLAATEADRTIQIVDNRTKRDRLTASEAAIATAEQHEIAAEESSHQAELVLSELRLRLTDAQSTLSAAEQKRAHAIAEAEASAAATKEAVLREERAAAVLAEVSHEAEIAYVSADSLKADTLMAEEVAKARGAGVAAARLEIGEAHKRLQSDAAAALEASAMKAASEAAMQKAACEADRALVRHTIAQKDFAESRAYEAATGVALSTAHLRTLQTAEIVDPPVQRRNMTYELERETQAQLARAQAHEAMWQRVYSPEAPLSTQIPPVPAALASHSSAAIGAMSPKMLPPTHLLSPRTAFDSTFVSPINHMPL